MKKSLGFSSFEFYFVMSIIGVILLVGFHRYNRLADETRRLSFEVLAQNFSAAVQSQHAHWIISQQRIGSDSLLDVENRRVQFSPDGWPIGVDLADYGSAQITLSGCFSLWVAFLQNAPAISVRGANPPPKESYRLALSNDGQCRYIWTLAEQELHFDYSPVTGVVKINNLQAHE
ncbi:hypothetical protein [Cellvibrio sp.]|uniref:hypothetical protein n=1 Tax=Cellvibrio sp. TaxID=1965322 RepID=UPI00396476FA